MYQIISLILFITGLVLSFAPEYILSKDTQKMIYEYHQILGFGCVTLAYYFYTLESDSYTIEPLETIESTRSNGSVLPSYEKFTDELS